MFVIKLNANFSGLAEICIFFDFILFIFGFICLKNKSIFAISWEFDEQNWKIYAKFSRNLGKLVVQIKDDYYIN